ncbi:MAG: TerB family tellurite resistance protein [SAR324 cluster bacterium]|nr:TerB family tellurite resistance protein [SAR324 cluster bacterium]
MSFSFFSQSPSLYSPETSAFTQEFQKHFPTFSGDQFHHSLAVLGLMTSIALIDHEIVATEEKFYRRCIVKKLGVTSEEAQCFIDTLIDQKIHITIADRQFFQEYLEKHCERAKKNEHLRLLFEMAAADRTISINSCVMLSRIAKALGLTTSEYDVARLPYIHVIESKEAGLIDERSFERIEYPHPATVEYRNTNKPIIFEDISMSGFGFFCKFRFLVHTPVTLILKNHFRFLAHILRAEKYMSQWALSAEFDLDYTNFRHLKYLIDIDTYQLDQLMDAEQLNLLALIPFHLLAYLKEIPRFSRLVPHALSHFLDIHAGSPPPLSYPLFISALSNQELTKEITHGTLHKDLQILKQGTSLLEQQLPDTIALTVKAELYQWLHSLVTKRRYFWRVVSLNSEEKHLLEEVAQCLNFEPSSTTNVSS